MLPAQTPLESATKHSPPLSKPDTLWKLELGCPSPPLGAPPRQFIQSTFMYVARRDTAHKAGPSPKGLVKFLSEYKSVGNKRIRTYFCRGGKKPRRIPKSLNSSTPYKSLIAPSPFIHARSGRHSGPNSAPLPTEHAKSISPTELKFNNIRLPKT